MQNVRGDPLLVLVPIRPLRDDEQVNLPLPFALGKDTDGEGTISLKDGADDVASGWGEAGRGASSLACAIRINWEESKSAVRWCEGSFQPAIRSSRSQAVERAECSAWRPRLPSGQRRQPLVTPASEHALTALETGLLS